MKKTLRMKLRHMLTTGAQRAMLSQGAVLKVCPHCGNETPIYYHQSYRCAGGCLWCGKRIYETFCSLCHERFDEEEMPWTFVQGFFAGQDYHANCYKKICEKEHGG